jgi:hypothetical protein
MPYPHKYITLTPEEREKIKKELYRLLMARKYKKRKPLTALYLSDQKKTISSIAKYLEKTNGTVRNWFYRYEKEGLDGLILWINRSGFGKGRSV